MMLRLYKFTCAPNYPVCKAVTIFAVKDYLAPDQAMRTGQDCARRAGCSNFLDSNTLEYLGTFMPATEPSAIPYVIHAETGEY